MLLGLGQMAARSQTSHTVGSAIRRSEFQVPDAESGCACLLWRRDFRFAPVIAEIDGDITGFVAGYLRPEAADVVLVGEHRGRPHFGAYRSVGGADWCHDG
ncbi:hypothetical protein [Nocardia vaccinii]|uniref:hypothetical protein n=1 Tax=Nocardia vaccinii TaxID=1822 RepID=UPI000B2180AF|nr:hypothetical protein [Nocardia vaccinii]